jgi:hypothetical protein
VLLFAVEWNLCTKILYECAGATTIHTKLLDLLLENDSERRVTEKGPFSKSLRSISSGSAH